MKNMAKGKNVKEDAKNGRKLKCEKYTTKTEK
jgi:hypothetical protein